MPDHDYPLLVFPASAQVERSNLRPGRGSFVLPSVARQGERISPKLVTLQAALEAERLHLQAAAPGENPEFVVVFETVGAITNFYNAVSKVPGLEWLLETDADGAEPDIDFQVKGSPGKPLAVRLFLIGTNQQALAEIIALWNRYQTDSTLKFERGLAPWKQVFKHLRDVRWWGAMDRIREDVRMYWQGELDAGRQSIRFEIDAWCFKSAEKNEGVRTRIEALVFEAGGQTMGRALILEIGYHGFLVELPAESVASILAGDQSELILSDRIMYFRPRAQCVIEPDAADAGVPASAVMGEVTDLPVIALLDGFPLQNHPLLAGRLLIDDPDGWEATYEAKDRVHGSAMASLIVHGELDGEQAPLRRPVYVRPVLRPDPADVRSRRAEVTPNDVLLVDLIHRAVKRICEGDAGEVPVAPTVRIINLSIGDTYRVFDRELSPWARLLDWLSFKFCVLFIVSAGNWNGELTLDTPRGTLTGLTDEARHTLAMHSVLATEADRRLLAPAESINALTVGATHSDAATIVPVADRFDLFTDGIGSPFTRIGNGYRRAVKPDILMPGGRILHREPPAGPPGTTIVNSISGLVAPGHRVACPPSPGTPNATNYCRGTSNSAALASRAAAQAFDIVETIRTARPALLPPAFDAVIIKALLAHGASWGKHREDLLSLRPDLSDWRQEREFVARWLGYGAVDLERALFCAENRATLLGVGEVGDGGALVFEMPLPPGLSAQATSRRLVITLAWLSPTNSSHQAYRGARLWISPPTQELRVKRLECVDDHATRGTLQHELLEGNEATAFVDGAKLQFKVNCAADAGKLEHAVPFAICVSLEVPVEAGIMIYQQVRARVTPPIAVGA